jgi:hypothetical protein
MGNRYLIIALLALMGCGDKEGKTITNTVEGPKKCCRQVSQETIYPTGTSKGEWHWTGDRLDSTVFTTSASGNYSVTINNYTDNHTRRVTSVSIINGKRETATGYTMQTVDDCGNVTGQISYDKDGKELMRTTFVFKCQ